MLKFKWIAAVAACAMSSGAFAMNADLFYRKAAGLQQMGPAAPLSPEFPSVMSEARSAASRVKAENEAAKRRGKPLFCAPAGMSVSPQELMTEMRALGTVKRKAMTVQQAFRAIAIKRYPCR